MNGKIFKESENIYQDQAKVLCDYYLKAAENIVKEEKRYEDEIEKLSLEKETLNKDLSKANLYKWLFAILIVPFIVNLIKGNKLKKQIAAINDRVNEFNKLHDEIFRDYKISKLGIAYVPVAEQVQYEDKSFIVDYTTQLNETEIKLQVSKQNDLLINTIEDIKELTTTAPIVEKSEETEEINTDHYSKSVQSVNQHDYFGKLERSLRTIKFCMSDMDVSSVSLPLVGENSEYHQTLKEFTTDNVEENALVLDVFDDKKYQDDIGKFHELNKLKDALASDTEQFQDVLKDLMVTMSRSVQTIASLKIKSTNKVVDDSNKLLYKILKSPYNHYSPILEAEEIDRIKNEDFNYGDDTQEYVPFNLKESSRVKYNILTNSWEAEDGSSTNYPFAVHQIQQEIIAPIVQNLMKENRTERLKIYNHIKDQKISYLNKWHQDTEDFYGRNRAESADLINIMRASLKEYVASYNTLKSLENTEKSMSSQDATLDSTIVEAVDNQGEVMAAFDVQSKEFMEVQTDFENYMERLKEDIDRKAATFEHINFYDALLSDGNFKDTAIAGDEVHCLDERRKELAEVNPLFAKEAQLLPEPSVENVVFEDNSINLLKSAENSLKEIDAEDNRMDDLVAQPENETSEGPEGTDNEGNGEQEENDNSNN